MIRSVVILLLRSHSHAFTSLSWGVHTSTSTHVYRAASSPSPTSTSLSAKKPKKKSKKSRSSTGVRNVAEELQTSEPSTSSTITDELSPINQTPDMKAFSSGYGTVRKELPCERHTLELPSLPPDLVGTYFRAGPAMFTSGAIAPPLNTAVTPKFPPEPDGNLERMVSHPYEGDGGVYAISFHGGGSNTCTSRFRFVRTAGFENERKKGFKSYKAMESTRLDPKTNLGNEFPIPGYKHHLLPGLNKKRKNTSNNRAIYWSKKLLTLWEGGLPYKLDGLALSTEGRSQLGGVLPTDAPFAGSVKIVRDINDSRKKLVSYSNRGDGNKSEVTVYEFNTKFRVNSKLTYELPGYAILSDLGVTAKYVILVQPTVQVNNFQFLLSKDPAKSLQFDQTGGGMIHLCARGSEGKTFGNGQVEGEMVTVELEPDGRGNELDLQIVNAYDDEENQCVVMDVLRTTFPNNPNTQSSVNQRDLQWPWAQTLDTYQSQSPSKQLWRYTIAKNLQVTREPLFAETRTVMFGNIHPEVSGRKHRFVYANIGGLKEEASPPQGVARFDVETRTYEAWMPEPYEFCGEPTYAPRSKAMENAGEEEDATDGSDSDSDNTAEDDGYILSLLYNGKTQTSEMLVFDASDLPSGPRTRIPITGLAIPHGHYGCYAPQVPAPPREEGDETDEEEEETLELIENLVFSADEIERRSKLADKMEQRGNQWNEVKSDFSGLGLRLDDFEEYFGDML